MIFDAASVFSDILNNPTKFGFNDTMKYVLSRLPLIAWLILFSVCTTCEDQEGFFWHSKRVLTSQFVLTHVHRRWTSDWTCTSYIGNQIRRIFTEPEDTIANQFLYFCPTFDGQCTPNPRWSEIIRYIHTHFQITYAPQYSLVFCKPPCSSTTSRASKVSLATLVEGMCEGLVIIDHFYEAGWQLIPFKSPSVT